MEVRLTRTLPTTLCNVTMVITGPDDVAKLVIPLRCPCKSKAATSKDYPLLCHRCKKVTCFLCDQETPRYSYIRWWQCPSCTRAHFERTFATVAEDSLWGIPSVAMHRNYILDMAGKVIPFAHLSQWKEGTMKNYAYAARNIQEFGETIGINITGNLKALRAEIVVSYFIARVDEGEGVAPETAKKELTVFSHWYNKLCQDFPSAMAGVPHPVRNPMVQSTVKRAHLRFQRDPVRVTGFDIEHLIRFMGDGKISGVWQLDHSRLCALLLMLGICRSIGAGNIRWKGDSDSAIAAVDSDIDFGIDRNGATFTHITVERDKTLGYKKSAHRYIPDALGLKLGVASYIRAYIRRYKVPSGSFLLAVRKSDGTFHVNPFQNWARVVADMCKANGLGTDEYGSHSFRRGCAEWLARCGLDLQAIRLLGFWLSDAVKVYTGNQSEPRLMSWRQAIEQAQAQRLAELQKVSQRKQAEKAPRRQ